MSDNLGNLVRKFYSVPGVLGVHARWEDYDDVVRIRVRYDTPELRAAVEAVMKGRPYVLELQQMTATQARELDASITSAAATKKLAHDQAQRLGRARRGWGPTGETGGAYGEALRDLRAGGVK